MIGGEFEIDLSTQRDTFKSACNTYYYATGRTALYQILKSLRHKMHKVWFPDWLCHTMLEAAENAGFEYCFYELSRDLLASVESLGSSGFKDGDVVLMVNYFGLQDLVSVSKTIKSAYPKSVVIEDDVQAYYCFAEESNPYADYRFTSLRKAFAIPDGGVVYTKHSMPMATAPNTFSEWKLKAGVMKMNRGKNDIKDEDYLALFERGSELIDEEYECIMSETGKRLYAGTDFQKVKQRRKTNTDCILDCLNELCIKPIIDIPDNKIPLFVPIYLENRNEVRKRLFANEIYCPVHWPLEGMKLKMGGKMAEHELSIIVDQRYTVDDMKRLMSIIKPFII